MLNETAISALKSELRGELIEPNDTRYDAMRKVYNAMIDRKPRLIARCADAADVIAAVKFAREHKLPLSIRGGGHNAAGLGICDDGLVVDLSPIKFVRVDPKNALSLQAAEPCGEMLTMRRTHSGSRFQRASYRRPVWAVSRLAAGSVI